MGAAETLYQAGWATAPVRFRSSPLKRLYLELLSLRTRFDSPLEPAPNPSFSLSRPRRSAKLAAPHVAGRSKYVDGYGEETDYSRGEPGPPDIRRCDHRRDQHEGHTASDERPSDAMSRETVMEHHGENIRLVEGRSAQGTRTQPTTHLGIDAVERGTQRALDAERGASPACVITRDRGCCAARLNKL